ncbi:sterol desaturase family protein [Brumicola pallidula]|uniref:Alkylglycerol monooxygenase n=1 Tax=Brumicola pallidula DSM 14239 = ACAM 615 TaxID=1121922 RepID=K6YTD0_9ALTE|nr:sterol desaturase family protein [Glaciecola pallidula]GAC27221.1 alkylglycerol monooxygenase [Glaciecola pallidula DSM 14239 = ACAM 615]
MNEIDARILQYNDFFTAVVIIGIIFYVLTIIETIFDISTKRRLGWKETMANVAIEIGNRILDSTVIGAVFIIGFLFVEEFAVAKIAVTWWSWLLAIIAVDFTYYWMHRIEHERRILWAVHSVHHSSQEYNLTTALRLSWLESLYEWLFFIPLLLIGFDAVQILASLFAVVLYQTWIHTEKVGKLGWLDGILNTPSVHRVHHATNADYIDKNYGGILIIWDRLFGTYQAENEKPIYGLTTQLESSNPLTINFGELRTIYKDVIHAESLSHKASYAFGRTGWQPRKCAKQTVDE